MLNLSLSTANGIQWRSKHCIQSIKQCLCTFFDLQICWGKSKTHSKNCSHVTYLILWGVILLCIWIRIHLADAISCGYNECALRSIERVELGVETIRTNSIRLPLWVKVVVWYGVILWELSFFCVRPHIQLVVCVSPIFQWNFISEHIIIPISMKTR